MARGRDNCLSRAMTGRTEIVISRGQDVPRSVLLDLAYAGRTLRSVARNRA